MNMKKGRYRVLLIGIGDNTEAKKESFCQNISENYGISFPLLRKIVDRCPIVLKKNLSLEKAVGLAKTLKSFGAAASVEEKRDSLAILLEFQEIKPHLVALESSSLRRTESGAWNVIGRVKNISDESLSNTWALIQLLDNFEEVLTFEEVPIPISPLLPGKASPFKVVFKGNLPIKKVSIAFKNSSGHPLPSEDRRTKREWIEVELEDENEPLPYSLFFASEDEGRSPSLDIAEPLEEISTDKHLDMQVEQHQSFEGESPSLLTEESPHKVISEGAERSRNSIRIIVQRESDEEQTLSLLPLGAGEGEERTLPSELESNPDLSQDISHETPLASVSEEATPSAEEIPKEEGKEEPSPTPWIEQFRNSLEVYYEKPRGIFSTWFETQRKGEGFNDSLHSLLTILVHARFDHMSHSEKALENTQRVFRLSIQPNLQLEQIPPLESTQFFLAEDWRVLFHRATIKLQQVANNILEKRQWEALNLMQLIQIIPHMSHPSSRIAVRWIHELIPDIITIDFSNTPVSAGEGLYRVASRLGVVDPDCDFYQGENSIGDLKIQSFAKAVFPQDPLKIEEPMTWVGTKEEGGHCFPIQPRCKGCLFEAFCPRLYSDFNPSEKGMRHNQ
jgi:hypothetical protein